MFGLLDDAAVIDRLGASSREENAACGAPVGVDG